METAAPVTRLLVQWRQGEQECLNQLVPLVESELRRIAKRFMRFESPGHTLQTTALVNEAYLRLVDETQVDWQDRTHFFAIAARLMRHILLDHARGSRRAKRGGGAYHLPLDEGLVFSPAKSAALIALDEALHIHPNTVIRDWSFAKVWLKRELTRAGGDAG